MIVNLNVRITRDNRLIIGRALGCKYLPTEKEIIDYIRIAVAEKLVADELRPLPIVKEVNIDNDDDEVEWEVIE